MSAELPLTALQIRQARHTLQYLASNAQSTRTSLEAMYAHLRQRQHVTVRPVVLAIDRMITDLQQLRMFLTGESDLPGQAMEQADKFGVPEGLIGQISREHAGDDVSGGVR